MEAELHEFRKSLSTQSSGVVESSALLSTRGASVPVSFNHQDPLEDKTQSEILRQLGMEMSQSPQATILRRMKEEARNKDTSLGKLEDERIVALEKEAMTRELDHLLTEEVPLAVADMLRVLTECMDDLKGDTEEENRNREAQETLEQERARLRKKVASNLDSMLKYGLKVKEKEEEEPKPPAVEDEKKGPKRNYLLDFNKKTEGDVAVVRGFAAVSGWRVFKSELRIKVNPTWGKKLPVAVKAQVSPLDPLRLPQIQNAHNYMRMAIGELKRLQRLMNKNEGKAEQRILTEAFKRIKDELRMAREELVTYEMHDFPDSLFAPSGFLPALPPDIAVEFHGLLQSGGAIVDPSTVSRNRLPKPHTRQMPAVEIMDAIRIPCDVPALKNAVHALEQADDLADELRDKLLAVCYNFRSAGMHMTRPGDEAERTEEEDSLLDDSQSEPEDESNSEKEQ
ncbi:uncharacterized protein ACA1_221050 [Acanthamoeba castellanii str. Neff]|uniref:Uncharacterized protein n=1 Tax=Acanthamoeba castellanii (strain ATCC 30010 / Neff) TaxID=1257118 RepID=L8GQ62_ACACF|nr:uncharacterized protein ACA1_221050 [Acanthamoeba castellanii str. Neff]ELR15324.1 hypothetical protein ACA1_221050 [Acanthamoeba castellanii str. Neff]